VISGQLCTNERIVAERFLRALLALAERVESVAELAGDFGLRAQLGEERRRRVPDRPGAA